MSSGKTSRMPNTAISTPTVRKSFCQNALIRSSTVALTTALSKDSEISRIPRMAQRTSPVTPAYRKARSAHQGDRVRKAENPKVHVLCFWLADADSMSSVPGFVAGTDGYDQVPSERPSADRTPSWAALTA